MNLGQEFDFARPVQVAVIAGVMGALSATTALAGSDASRIRNCEDSDWCSYHRTVDSAWRYSPLAQINTDNVSELRPAWIFQPGQVRQGIHSTPLAIDGNVYAITNPATVWKLDGVTGDRVWSYEPEIDQAVLARTFFGHSRSISIGDGRIYAGMIDGAVVALDENTGEEAWRKQLIDSAKETVGFSGSGTFVGSDMFVICQNGGEYPIEGKCFGMDPSNGDVKWTFYTTGRGDEHALSTWGGDSWKYGGGGSWQPGTIDYGNNQIFIGTGNPNPDYDYCGDTCRDANADAHRPGDNLYTSSTIALDLDTGSLNWYFQEAPSDPYDYDASPGEYVMLNEDGRSLVLHPGKNGFNHVHDAKTGQPVNVYPDMRSYNWTTGFNLETGQWENMLWPKAGEKTLVCPAIDGGHSWNAGAYSPQTGLFYRNTQEWCMWLTVGVKGGSEGVLGSVERTVEPVVQAFFNAEFQGTNPPGDTNHAWLTGRDPVSGDIAWEKRYDIIPHSALMATAGGLLFNGTTDGYAEAMDAATGALLWRFNNGSGHNGGIISYQTGGKQYVLFATGHGSYVGRAVAGLNEAKLVNYEESAAFVAFSLD